MHTHTLKIKTILFSLILTCTALTGCSESDINTYINDIASMKSHLNQTQLPKQVRQTPTYLNTQAMPMLKSTITNLHLQMTRLQQPALNHTAI